MTAVRPVQPPDAGARWGKVPARGAREAGNYGGTARPAPVGARGSRAAGQPGSRREARRAAGSGQVGVGGEALAAAALGTGVGIAEQELVAQLALLDVDDGAIDLRQAEHVHEDPHPAVLEHGVARLLAVRKVGHVLPAGAAGALHPE